MHHRARDLRGRRFGRLEAIRYAGSDGRKSKWLCRCDCGTEREFVASELAKGRTNSCGCLRRELASDRHRTHGMTSHPAFAVWRSMIDRCTLPTHQAWKNYGARGITVCVEWRDSFEAFWRDMGPTYQRGLTLDRRDNSKGYSPENCAWRTVKDQARNKRTNRTISTPWGEMTVAEAAERSGVGVTTLLYRLSRDVPGPSLFAKPDVRNRFSTCAIAGREIASS